MGGVHYFNDVIASVFTSSAAVLAWLRLWNNLIALRLGNHAGASALVPEWIGLGSPRNSTRQKRTTGDV
jgi:membrane-associated phospholipid phosphatase